MVTVTAVIIGGRRYFLTLQKIWHNGKNRIASSEKLSDFYLLV